MPDTNGTVDRGLQPLTLNEFREKLDKLRTEILTNASTLSRSSFLQQAADPRRDLNSECGYPGRWVDPQYYQDLYDREPIATRVVQLYPLESWQVQPSVYEKEDAEAHTPFEEGWDALPSRLRGGSKYKDEKGNPIWEYLKRVDILSGIGRYGVILFGIDDGLPLSEPVEGWEETNSFPAAPEVEEEEETDEDGNTRRVFKATGNTLGTPWNPQENNRAVYNLRIHKPKPPVRNRVTERTTGSDIPNAGGIVGITPEDDDELPEGVTRRLLYLRVFPESLARITRYETNPSSPRYGFPTQYALTLNDPNLITEGIGYPTGEVMVHWTRIQHVAEVIESSEVLAPSRLQHPLNDVLNCQKVKGSSAEGFYRCGFPGYSFETHPELGGDVDVDKEDMRAMFEEWSNGLQRALFTAGFSIKTLAPTVTDPRGFLEPHIESICIKMACPIRVFKGSERGELASSQDDAAWNDRLKERQTNYVTPRILIPFIDRLIAFGVLPEPEEYHIWWPDLTSKTDSEKAAVAVQRTTAAGTYVTSGANQLIPELYFFTHFLGMDEEEAQAIVDAKLEQIEEQESGEVSQGSALLQLVGGITGAIEMFKAAKDGALSEDQLKQLLMLFYQLSEGKAEEIIGDGLTPAAEEAGDPPEPEVPVLPFGAAPPNGPPGAGKPVPPFSPGKPGAEEEEEEQPLPPMKMKVAANRLILHGLYFPATV